MLAVAPPLGLVVWGAEVLCREPGAGRGVREGQAAPTEGSCLGDSTSPWNLQQQQELPSRDRSFVSSARGEPNVPGAALPSPALETDSGPAMEEREPPPRCATRDRAGKGAGCWGWMEAAQGTARRLQC